MRIVRTGSKPVAGRPAPGRFPPFDFCIVFPMIFSHDFKLHFSGLKIKRPADVFEAQRQA